MKDGGISAACMFSSKEPRSQDSRVNYCISSAYNVPVWNKLHLYGTPIDVAPCTATFPGKFHDRKYATTTNVTTGTRLQSGDHTVITHWGQPPLPTCAVCWFVQFHDVGMFPHRILKLNIMLVVGKLHWTEYSRQFWKGISRWYFLFLQMELVNLFKGVDWHIFKSSTFHGILSTSQSPEFLTWIWKWKELLSSLR